MKVRSHKNAPGVLVGGWRADRTETFQPPSNLFPSLPLPHRHLIILLLVTRLPKALGFCRTCAQQCCSGRLTDSPGAISSSQTVAFCKAYHRSLNFQRTLCHPLLPSPQFSRQFSPSSTFPHSAVRLLQHNEYSCFRNPGSFPPFSPVGSHLPSCISQLPCSMPLR